MLEAIGLTKIYNGRRVVNSLSLQVEKGKIIGLLGPNGAGKTTAFHMMIGFVAPEKGEVYLDGKAITRLSFYSRARLGIGYLPQEPSVFTKMSVVDNLDAILEWNVNHNTGKEIREELLREFKLEKLRHQRAGTLSSGERRRVEIARTLATSPSYILFDEPFSGIDPLAISDLKQEIIALRHKGIGVIMTDHNVRDIMEIVDYLYLINEGKLVVSGTPEEIINNELARKFYLGEEFTRSGGVDRAAEQ
jgi:lipopolysaccharide export system ATP-binding protein